MSAPAKHTPGPWEVEADRPQMVHAQADGTFVADCCGGNCDDETDEANARLIAAAPELLAIAESIKITGPDADGLVWLQIEDDGIDGLMAVNLGKRERVVAQVALLFEESRRAAVAKARGEA